MEISHSQYTLWVQGPLSCKVTVLWSQNLRKKGVGRGMRGHLAHSSTIKQDELHLRLSGQTFLFVLTISHITSSPLPIQFTPERPSCYPTLTAMKLPTSHRVSHSYKRQFVPMCYCSTLYIWRLLSCSLLYWPATLWQVGHIFLRAHCPAPSSTTQAKERRRFTKRVLQRTFQSIHPSTKTVFFHSSVPLLSCAWFEIHHNIPRLFPAGLLSGRVSHPVFALLIIANQPHMYACSHHFCSLCKSVWILILPLDALAGPP